MARAKKYTADDPEQSARFVEAAKAGGAEEIGSEFRRGLAMMAPVKKADPKAVRKTKRAKRA